MNILMHELKRSVKSTLIWGGVLVAFIYMFIMEFTVYYENPELIEILDTMPAAMLEAFGMYGVNIATVSGFVGVSMLYIQIMLGIHAALIGSRILAGEERDKTAEFLMTLPVKREKIVIMKAIAAIGICLLLNIVTAAMVFLNTLPFETEVGYNRFLLLLFISTFLLQLFFMCTGLLLAATKWHKRSGGMAVGILFALYLVSVFSNLSDDLEALRHVTPFRYFEAGTIWTDMRLEPGYVLVMVVCSAAFFAATYVFYSRRDLKI